MNTHTTSPELKAKKPRLKSFSGGAGEHLVLGEILKRRVESYLAHGKTQPGWDIAVINADDSVLRVQVKAISWPKDLAVNGKFDEGFDVLVVVLLNGSEQSKFLIIPHSKLDPILSPRNEMRSARTLTVGKGYEADEEKNLIQYENRWDYITDGIKTKELNSEAGIEVEGGVLVEDGKLVEGSLSQ